MSARGSFLGSPRVKQDDRNASNCRSICSATFRASEWLKCWMGPWYSWGYRLVSPGHTFERIVQGCKEWQCCGQKYPHTPLIQLSTQRYNSSIRPYSWTISDIFTLKTGLAFKWLACLHVNESQISNVHLWSPRGSMVPWNPSPSRLKSHPVSLLSPVAAPSIWRDKFPGKCTTSPHRHVILEQCKHWTPCRKGIKTKANNKYHRTSD